MIKRILLPTAVCLVAALGCKTAGEKSAAKEGCAKPPCEKAPCAKAPCQKAPCAESAEKPAEPKAKKCPPKKAVVMCPTRRGRVCDGTEQCLKRGRACPKANCPGTIARRKMMALMAATKTNSLKEIRAAARELAKAMANHQGDEEMREKPDYQQMQKAAMGAIQKVITERSTIGATKAAKAVHDACAECHAVYK